LTFGTVQVRVEITSRACFDKIESLGASGGTWDEHGLEVDEHGFWELLREAFKTSVLIRAHPCSSSLSLAASEQASI
jgi:hypothetical protein